MAQTPAAAKRCRFHFLLCRIRERDWMKTATVAQIVAKLQSGKSKWGTQPTMAGKIDYLDRWIVALK